MALELPAAFVDMVAERAAELVIARFQERRPVSPYWTVPEAAEFLRCSRQRVDDLLSQRRLGRVKEGGRTLVLRSEVEALAVAPPLPRRLRGRIGREVA